MAGKMLVVDRREVVAEEEEKKLNEVAEESKLEVFGAHSVFPFDLFPDKITIDINKVTLVHRFILSRQVFPMLIEDINTARDFRGVFFSSLSIEISGYEQNPPPMKFLKHSDAATARRFILALLECKRSGVDLSKLSRKKIISKLEEVGKVLAEREAV